MRYKKREVTLIEIMIVIFLISLIGGVIGYNMKGSLERGRVFKTEMAIAQLDDIFQLEAAKGIRSNSEIAKNPEVVLRESGLVKKPEELLKDGWNNKFVIKGNKDGFEIYSKKYQEYCDKNLSKSSTQLNVDDNDEEN